MPFVEMGMSNLKFQFCPYWVFSVDQTFTQRSPVGKYVSLGLRDDWAGDTIPWDWMSSQRNECRYKRQEDPRAQSYSITTLRGQGEETESAKKIREGNIGVLGENQVCDALKVKDGKHVKE